MTLALAILGVVVVLAILIYLLIVSEELRGAAIMTAILAAIAGLICWGIWSVCYLHDYYFPPTVQTPEKP